MKKYLLVIFAVLLCLISGCNADEKKDSISDNKVFTDTERNDILEESNSKGNLKEENTEVVSLIEEPSQYLDTNDNKESDTSETSEYSLRKVKSATIEVITYGPQSRTLCNITDIERLYILLNGLDYKTGTCDGLSEYKFSFDNEEIFYLNLTDRWVWRGNGKEEEAHLAENEIDILMSCIDISIQE